MNRRGFLGTCLALGAAPAIVRAESLMKLWVPPQEIFTFFQPMGAYQPMNIPFDAVLKGEIFVWDRALSNDELHKLIAQGTRCSRF